MMNIILKRIRNVCIIMVMLTVIGFVLMYTQRSITEDTSTADDTSGHNIISNDAVSSSSDDESVEVPDTEDAAEQEESGYTSIYLSIDQSSVENKIALFLDNADAYFFLPAYSAANCNLYWAYDEAVYQINLNGNTIRNGDSLPASTLNDSYEMELNEYSSETDTWESRTYQLAFLQSANIPCIYVDTYYGTMDYVNAEKGNKEPGKLTCILSDGSIDAEYDFESIHYRGATSANTSKKSYKINFANAVDLISMGAGTSWILQANALDDSRMRNKICYDLAKALGLPGAVSAEYADIYFNGEYGGNYLIIEPVEVAENRLDISDDSVLLETNWMDRVDTDSQYIIDDYDDLFEIRYPESEAITDETKEEIRTLIVHIEELLNQCQDNDVYQQLTEYVDMESLAAAYLMGQLCNEIDQNDLSTFYYIDGADGKLYAGPAWDYDKSYGNEADRGLYVTFNSFFSGFPEQLSNNSQFMEIVNSKLEKNIDTISKLSENVPLLSAEISKSLDMDSVLWETDYQEDSSYLEWYIRERTSLIIDTIQNPDLYHKVYINDDRSGRFYWARDGEPIPASVISYICDLYSCSHLLSAKGSTIGDAYPILSDVVITTASSVSESETNSTATGTVSEPETDSTAAQITQTYVETSNTSKKEFLGMNILIFIILVAPGFIAMYLSGELKAITKSNLGQRIGQYFVYEFLVLLFTYGMIVLTKGNTTVSLSLEKTDTYYTVYDVTFVFGIMAIELVGACILDVGKLFCQKLKKTHLDHGSRD